MKNSLTTREEILKESFSESFVTKMKNAIEMSHHKYGLARKTYPELAQAYKCIQERLDCYVKTHNTEYLVDVANFAMLEFMFPAFEDAKYVPQSSDSSPGLAGGIGYKQLMDHDSYYSDSYYK